MKKNHRLSRLLAVAVAAGLALTACSFSGGEDPTGDPVNTTFITGLSSQPDILVRSFTSDAEVATVSLAMTEGLVRTTGDKDVVPALAEKWDVSEDGTEYTFYLRSGVTWHDGEPFSSADVVFSFEEIMPLSPTAAVLTATIEGVEALDDLTVSVKLKRPLAPILLALGPQDFTIQPKHIYEGSDPLENPNNRAPIGTGPFKFESWSGNTITLVRNDNYWGGKPALEKLIYQVIPDSNSRANAMLTGEIDYINKFDVDDTIVAALSGKDDILLQNGRVSATFMTMWLNHEVAPLGDNDVRKALLMALDRNLMSKAADPDFTVPARGSFPVGLWATDGDIDYMKQYPYDPAAAAALLDAAGYPEQSDGSRFSIEFRHVPSQPYVQALAAIIADNWGAIGVKTVLVQDESTVFNDAVFAQHSFGAAILSLDTRPDPEFGIGRVYKCNPKSLAFNNPGGYCANEVDTLFAAAASATTQEERKRLYAEVQAIIAEQLPALTLLQADQPDAVRASFGNIDKFLSGALSGDLTWSALTP